MNLSADPVAVPMKPSDETDTRLRNPWLTVARVTWVALVALALGLVIAGIPLFYFGEPFGLVARVHEQVLGFSSDFWLIFYATRYISFFLICFATAVLIFWHKSDDWMAMLVSATLVLFGQWPFRAAAMLADDPVWGFGVALVDLLTPCVFLLFLYLFPNGRFVPRWIRLLAIVICAWLVVEELFPASPLAFSYTWPESIYLPFAIGWGCTGIFSQVYRYVRVSGPLERQQMKWVLFGMVSAVLGLIADEVLAIVIPPGYYYGALHSAIGSTACMVFQLLLPLSIAIAVLHYRLWDIDVVFNRTLIYGTLTTLLAAVFAGSAALISQVGEKGFGAESKTVAVVVSAILVVAIFEPVRDAVRKWIDERFFPENVEIAREFVEFEPDVRSALTTAELLQIVVRRVCNLMRSEHGAILLADASRMCRAVETCNLEASAVPPQPLPKKMHDRWGHAKTVRQSEYDMFSVFVPLYVSRVKRDQVIGILGLGPREGGRGYSRDDMEGLADFGEKAGRAIYACQLHALNHKPAGEQQNRTGDSG